MRKTSLLALCALFLLASCRSPGDPTGADTTGIDPYPLSGTAAGYPGGGTTLDAVAWTTEPGPGLTGYVVDASGTGTIAADGTFSVTLDVMNRQGDVAHMMSFADLGCENLIVEPASGLYLVVDRIQVLQGDVPIGSLALASSADAAAGLEQEDERMVSWFYVPAETFVSGDCPGYGSYYLELAPGWNPVVSRKPTSQVSPEVDRETAVATSWASWYFVGN